MLAWLIRNSAFERY